MKNRIEQYFPVGIDYEQELKWVGGGFLLSFLYSLSFLLTFAGSYSSLFETVGNEKVLISGAVMPDFADLLHGRLAGFPIVAVCMAALLIYHDRYHYQGSKSIYLMRRLPERWELLKRCAALPLLAAAACLAIAALLLLIYFRVYMQFTPEACLTPGQWNRIWNV